MSSRSSQGRVRQALGADSGFTIVEALVAAVILTISALAIFSAYDASTRATFRAQQTQVELSQAQQEMEKIRSLGYDQIALTSAPDTSTDPNNPLYRVHNGKFNLNRTGTANYARLVVNGGTSIGGEPVANGSIDPGPDGVTNGDVRMNVWRFVVWQKNSGCAAPNCSGQDIKRVVIVVAPVDPVSGAIPSSRRYIEINADFTDPKADSVSNVPPNGSAVVTAQQIWLSDTPCDPDGETDRVTPADHALHNTLADCPTGVKTGATVGAPDSLLLGPPPGVVNGTYFDYATDVEPGPPPAGDPDKGIQMAPETQTSPQCRWQAVGSTSPQQKFHEWLSDPMPSSGFAIAGPVSLSFYSRTVNGGTYPGKICIWLFERSSTGVDHLFAATPTSASMTYDSSPSNWPSVYSNPANLPPLVQTAGPTSLTDADLTVNSGSRLGLAISVVGGVTPSPGLEFMYDHPLFPTHLDIGTTTPLD